MVNSFSNNCPVISIVAMQSGTGKTTLIENLIKVFKRKKYRLGILKHDAHKFEIDYEGKDTWRFAQAGADQVMISSKTKIALVEKLEQEKNITELISSFKNVDLIIIEGFKNNNYPKIEVHRKEINSQLVFGNPLFATNTFLAIASDEPLKINIPLLDLNDVNSIADFIEKKIML